MYFCLSEFLIDFPLITEVVQAKAINKIKLVNH